MPPAERERDDYSSRMKAFNAYAGKNISELSTV